MGGVISTKENTTDLVNVEKLQEYKNRTFSLMNVVDKYMVFTSRIPYLVEDTFGFNMNFYTAKNCPQSLITTEPRRLIKSGEIGELKKMIFSGAH